MTELRAIPVFSNDAVKVTAIERVEITRTSLAGCQQLFGKAEPVALVISDQSGIRALDMAGQALNIDQLPAELWTEHNTPG